MVVTIRRRNSGIGLPPVSREHRLNVGLILQPTPLDSFDASERNLDRRTAATRRTSMRMGIFDALLPVKALRRRWTSSISRRSHPDGSGRSHPGHRSAPVPGRRHCSNCTRPRSTAVREDVPEQAGRGRRNLIRVHTRRARKVRFAAARGSTPSATPGGRTRPGSTWWTLSCFMWWPSSSSRR
jgi:hypothetical protein